MINFTREIINLMKQDNDSWLLYTTSNEDTKSELTALDITFDDSVVCITGSACRSLALLAAGPKKLYSVDADVKQNYLMELKLKAFLCLSYEELLAFFGVHYTDERLNFYQSIRKNLSTECMLFWDKHIKEIEKGLVFTGRQELFYRHVVSKVINLFHGAGIKEILNSKTIEEQRRAYLKLNTWRWKKSLNILCKKAFYKHILKDPSYFAYSDIESFGNFLHSRLENTLTNHPIYENHLVTFLFTGNYVFERSLPVYLLEENYENIRKYANRVEIITAPIDQYLKNNAENTFDKYSLSDISGWVSDSLFDTILKEMIRTGNDESIFCYRNFLAERRIPNSYFECIERQEDVISKINTEDRSFAFTFEVGKIRKGVNNNVGV
ncbi:DUF3419 family protein [Bacillus thuringiensis]